jgi:predicted enzyme related to lactoylglutathione lyase
MKEWYKTHLGLDVNDYGATFEWKDLSENTKNGSTTWSPFAETSKYFEPSTKDYMINYTVEDLEGLVEALKKEGVTVLDNVESYDYGKFVHILDVEGNKVQLWEPAK